MLVCLYEDRPQQVAGLKLTLLSLNRFCPTWPVRLRFPGISASFETWLQQFQQVDLVRERLPFSGSYNVKPAALLDCLSTGAETCLWLDTDILINGSLEFIESIPPENIVVTQDPWEYPDGSTHRCETWGMPVGRSLPGPFNSGVVRVTKFHEPLLQEWGRIVGTPVYQAEQAKPVDSRNRHMLSDQDALSALLASLPFASIPIRKLMHATEILQHHGAGAYGPTQRLSNITRGMPPLLHAMGTVKPWRMTEHPNFLRDTRSYYERTYLELSPYVHFARAYREALKEDCSWLENRTLSSRIGTLASLNRPWLKGALQSTLHRAWFLARSRT
jgi:hypothetical protein